jgi:peptidoglycan/xylan/chitin deacetylase (PgdA/CDA1 family)
MERFMTIKKSVHCVLALWFVVISNIAHAAVILQYHHVSDTLPRSTSLSESEFIAHLSYLKEQNYHVVPLSQIINAIKNKTPLADKLVVITFDDGYLNNMTEAAPILAKFGYPYTIFVNPQLIDEKKSYVLSWDQLRELAQQGASIANHSAKHDYLHRRLENETLEQWRKRITKDITESERRIKEEIGHNFKQLAYPYGEFNRELQLLVAELGFAGIGQHSGAVGMHTDLTRIPRFPAAGNYANLKTLKTKIASLPFAFKVDAGSVTQDRQPTLDIEFITKDFYNTQFNCFVSGQSSGLINWTSDNQVTVQAKQPLGKGRSRYNCTAPSKKYSGRYYWLSQPWIVE